MPCVCQWIEVVWRPAVGEILIWVAHLLGFASLSWICYWIATGGAFNRVYHRILGVGRKSINASARKAGLSDTDDPRAAITDDEARQRSKSSPLGPIVGWLEQTLYVFAVIIDKYELITGWLVLKGFFGWLTESREIELRETPRDGQPIPSSDGGGQPDRVGGETQVYWGARRRVMLEYHSFVIGNIVSLFIGLSVGLLGKELKVPLDDLIGSLVSAL